MHWLKLARNVSRKSKSKSTSSTFHRSPQLEALEVRTVLSIDPVALIVASEVDPPVAQPQAVVQSDVQDWEVNGLSSFSVAESTGEKPQSKVWTHDGEWFAVMPNSSGTWVWRLDGSSWTQLLKISSEDGFQADVKATTGGVTHVVLFDGDSSELASIQYVAATRSYEFWSVRPGNVALEIDGSPETATIDIDALGRMWVCYDNEDDKTVEVRYSDGNYSSWSAPIVVASGMKSDDLAGIIAMPTGQIGVLWSNQNNSHFGFRTHNDGADPHSWNAMEVAAPQSVTGGFADDHLNLAVASDGTLYVAAKTSFDGGGRPEIILLVRRPDGNWDPAHTVSGVGTRPIVVLNEQLGKVLVAYTERDGGGDILYRESSTSSISFGSPQTLIGGNHNDVTSTKQNFTSEIVFLAGSGSSVAGTHLVGPVIADPQTNQPPVVSAGVDRSAVVGQPLVLGGSASDDGNPSGTLNLQWTQVGGPGVANFTSPTQAASSVTFDAPGVYVLRLTANDGLLTSYDEVTVTVSAESSGSSEIVGFWNFMPGVGAGYSSALGNQGALQSGASVNSEGRLSLGGGSQHYAVNDVPQLQISDAITITAWIKPSASGTQYIVKKASQSGVDGYELSLSAEGKVFVRFNQSSSGDEYRVDSTSSFPTNGTTWMHVAATYDGQTIRLYINGQLQGSKAASFSIATNNLPLTMGAGEGGYRAMRGELDEVMITDRALSAGEVNQVFFGSFNPGSAANQAPVVSAGPDRAATTDVPLELLGSASDDGRPSGTLSVTWSLVSGPGSVIFANSAEANTAATFSAAGNYVLRLTASDGTLTSTDQMTVTVTDPAPAPPHMVGFWNFLSGRGAAYPSLLGHTGSLQGGASVSGDGRLTLTAADQYYSVPDAPQLDISEAITITAWIKPSASGTQYVVKKAGNGTTDGYELGLSDDGKVFVRFNEQSSGDAYRVDSTSNFPTNGNTWMHVAATYDGQTIRLYVNGKLQSSKSATFNIATNDLPLTIGAGADGYRSMRGQIDEVLVSNRALSAAEIAQVHFGSYDPGQAPTENQAPSVSAGLDRSTPAGVAIQLSGVATDDGQPSGVLLTQWSVVSAPGSVSFANASSPNTSVTFLAAGTYVLRLTASDGALSSSDDVTVVVTSSASPSILGFWNFLEGVGAGYPSSIGGTGSLQGGASVNGDGRLELDAAGEHYAVPNSQQLQISQALTLTAWINPAASGAQTLVSKGDSSTDGFEFGLSAEGKVFIRFNAASDGDSFRVDSLSSYSVGGWTHVAATYDGSTIRLYVNGQLEGSKQASFTIGTNSLPLVFGAGTGGANSYRGQLDEVIVDNRALSADEIAQVHFGNFRPADPPPPQPTNQAPSVNAGVDRAAKTDEIITLAGTVSDDGLPSGTVNAQWSVVSGPGSVNFGSATSATTTATFSTAGTYLLRLTVTDGELSGSDELSVVVTPPPVIASGVVGYWNFSNTDDASEQGNHGILRGGATLGSGHTGSGLQLNANGQWVEVADAPSLDFSESITIAAWINPSSRSTQYIVKKADHNAVDGFELSLSSGGKVFVRFNQDSDGDDYRVDSSTKYPTDGDTWMHVVATYDGSTIRLYVNGVLEASEEASFTIASNDLPLSIGAGADGYRTMRGALDDVFLSGSALTQAEVTALYNGTFF